ncbi:MAG TPA: carboxymuconolactone decarboxylase family protein [Polyangiaceae bacterium]|jgi:AhpD family alkylhydroperoxidase|nr:carboxymuconolactone decarboxylase family protein [Polyangiaceae bacterium]
MTLSKNLITTLFATLLTLLGLASTAFAETPSAAAKTDIQKTLGFVPQFFQRLPDGMLSGTWEEMKTLQLNPATALDGRSKELIGLAVAAQVPCRYCIVAHTEFAKLNGATETELGEAVAMAAITRHWSTFLNGIQTDEPRFRAEIAKIIANVKQAAASKRPASAPVVVTDGASALREVTSLLGFAPEFLSQFPEVARAGAWKQMRDVQLNPKTALSGKTKELIGLAVAAQVPCRFCIVAHTEFAKLNGATDTEVREALALASFTRDMSTMLNGMQVDESQFKRDVDRLVRNAKAAAKKDAAVASR